MSFQHDYSGSARVSAGICTMHLVKGLEFRGVVMMACDDEVIHCKNAFRPSGAMHISRNWILSCLIHNLSYVKSARALCQ